MKTATLRIWRQLPAQHRMFSTTRCRRDNYAFIGLGQMVCAPSSRVMGIPSDRREANRVNYRATKWHETSSPNSRPATTFGYTTSTLLLLKGWRKR